MPLLSGRIYCKRGPFPTTYLLHRRTGLCSEQLIGLPYGNPLPIKVLMYDLLNHLTQDRALNLFSHLLSLLQPRPIDMDVEKCANGGGGARADAEPLDQVRKLSGIAWAR